MIYIISSSKDYSTSEIMDWLFFIKKDCIRITDLLYEEKKINISIDQGNNSNNFNIGNSSDTIDSIWFRKGETYTNKDNDIEIFNRNENARLIEFLFSRQNKTRSIGMEFRSINKLEFLNKAKKYDLSILPTLITNSRNELLNFVKNEKKVIIKPISEILMTKKNGIHNKGTYTKLISSKYLKKLPERFQTSLFQKFIKKEFDIRIFYLNGEIYPSAILSQTNNLTKVDFRRYPRTIPNRLVPIKLPSDIRNNIINFMKDEKLETSSIDMLKCQDTGNYYFLEVNPWGQFGMHQRACNYYIEKKIAEFI